MKGKHENLSKYDVMGDREMYEIKKISNNWYGIYNNVKRCFEIESTSVGIEFYRKLFEL